MGRRRPHRQVSTHPGLSIDSLICRSTNSVISPLVVHIMLDIWLVTVIRRVVIFVRVSKQLGKPYDDNDRHEYGKSLQQVLGGSPEPVKNRRIHLSRRLLATSARQAILRSPVSRVSALSSRSWCRCSVSFACVRCC